MFHLKNIFNYISKQISLNFMNFKTFYSLADDALYFEEFLLHEKIY